MPTRRGPLLDGLDVLVLDALREQPHPTHFSLGEAIEAARRIGARRTLFTHMCHHLPHEATNARLPDGMASPTTGLTPATCSMIAPLSRRRRRRAGTTRCSRSGNFDGLHRGHAKIIDRVRRRAGERGGTPAAMTFDPHPPRVVRPDKAPPLLMTTEQRLEALGRAGMQGVAVVRFTHEMSQWDPETFVRTVLVEWLHVVEVWVGANFLFGHDRAGTFTVLRTLGARYGFRAEKIDAVRYKDFVVSSTRIRRLSSEGRVDEAGALLGHHYFIDGTVVHGKARGREIGFPTANLATANELLPPAGVYATTAAIGGVAHPSVTNIGTRPTFGDTDRDAHRDASPRHVEGPLRRAHPPVVRAASARRARFPRRGRAARPNRGRLPRRPPAVRPHFAIESLDG